MTTTQVIHVEPLVGIGPIKLGMSKDEVSHAFRYTYESFFKTEASKVRADHCVPLGFIVYYDEHAKVNHIEIFQPGVPRLVQYLLFGKDVMNLSVSEVFELLSSKSNQYDENCYGFSFPKLGISMFNSNLESNDDIVECLGIGYGKNE